MSRPSRLVVVSNRLPITTECIEGESHVHQSGGGLVPALAPVLRGTGGCWVGWTGTDYDDAVFDLIKSLGEGYSLQPVFLTASEQACYYRGFSNEILWPLLHGLLSPCKFDPAYWKSYCQVNEKFAGAVASVCGRDDFIWIHDYHLMLQARALRARGLAQRLAYFHHVPFPCPDVFEALPWRMEILRALLHFNSLGFQTVRDRNNFIACLRRCLSGVRVSHIGKTVIVCADGQCASVSACPISIDYGEFAAAADQPAVAVAAEALRNKLGGVRVMLGVDRLDYTKGLPERLMALQTLFQQNPQWRGRVTMLQIVVPSREDIPEYRRLKIQIETLVTNINGQYSSPGWMPIQYFYRHVPRTELITFYRAADLALVTPLKDGMNLVAKEFCAARADSQGVLLLSEFAGAAEELNCGALLMNPYDTESAASLIHKALQMSTGEQRMRMRAMRSQIESNDVFRWARSFNVNSAPDAMLALA
jgi:alpha,alpha-trehalose-phosphate synthase [UDP-forming]